MAATDTDASARWRRRWSRRVLRGVAVAAAAALLLVAVGLAIALVPVIRDPTPGMLARKGSIASIETTSSWTEGHDLLTELTLTSTSGLRVEFSVRVPRDAIEPRPTILLLVGQGTGRDAVRYVADTRGIVVAAISYPYRRDPEAGTWALLLDLPRIQRALLDTTPATMLVADWLLEQPYVDPDRLELAGGSLGAFLVAVPGALDPRFRRVWLVHGGGDPATAIEHGLRSRIGFAPARRIVARLLTAAAYGHHLTPERWVGRISPREVLVISARGDESIPRSCVDALHRALAQPSEVIWMAGPHVLPKRTEIIEQLTDFAFTRMLEDPPSGAAKAD